MSMRCGSADSVVLPVPERPKKTAVSPVTGSMLADECMGSTSSSTGMR